MYINKYGINNQRDRSKLVDIECEIVHETEKGILLHNGTTQEWFPKAAIEYDRRDKVATMPEYMALEKGFV